MKRKTANRDKEIWHQNRKVMEEDISKIAKSYISMAKESKAKGLYTKNHLHASPHSQNRPQSHPVSSSSFQQTSVSIKNGCVYCRWTGNFAVAAKNHPLRSPSIQESRFQMLCRSRTLGMLLKAVLVSSFLSVMTPDTHKNKKAELANMSQVTRKLLRVWK